MNAPNVKQGKRTGKDPSKIFPPPKCFNQKQVAPWIYLKVVELAHVGLSPTPYIHPTPRRSEAQGRLHMKSFYPDIKM